MTGFERIHTSYYLLEKKQVGKSKGKKAYEIEGKAVS